MSVLVEGLEIQISQKSDKATDSIKALRKELSELRNVVKGATSNINSFVGALEKIAKYSNDAKNGINSVARKMSKTNDAMKDATQKVREYNDSLKETNDISKEVSKANNSEVKPNEIADLQSAKTFQNVAPKVDVDALKNMSQIQILERELSAVDEKIQKIAQEKPNSEELTRYVKQWQKLNKELENVRKNSNKLGTFIGEFKDGLSAITKKAKEFSHSFLRVGFYRAVRFVLSSIVSAVKEGYENAYKFSQVMGGELANKTDRITSLWRQTKNQIGSLASEVVLALYPAIVKILNATLAFADTLSQVFAVFNGDNTYKKAQYVAGSWKDAEDSVKSYKKQLLGIDEINNLTSDSGSKGGSKVTDDSLTYKYEKVALNPKIREVVEYIRDNFDDLLDIVGKIGKAILLWKLSSALLDGLADITGLANLKSVKAKVGLALAITGLTMFADDVFSLAMGEKNIWNWIKTTLDAGMTIGGFAMMFGTTGIAIAVPLLLTVGVIQMQKAKKLQFQNKFNETAFGKAHLKFTSDLDVLKSDSMELQARIASITTDFSSAQFADINMAKDLIEEIFNLADKPSKTSKEIGEINAKIQLLNSLGLEGIRLEYNELTGEINTSKQAILETIKAMEQQFKLKAYEEELTEAYKLQADATVEVTRAEEKHKEISNKLSEAKNAEQRAVENYKKAVEEQTKFEKENWLQVLKNSDAYKDLKKKTEKAKDEWQLAKKAVEDFTGDLSDCEQILVDNKKTVVEVEGKIKILTKMYSNAYAQVHGFAGEVGLLTGALNSQITSVKSLYDEYGKLASVQVNKGTDASGKPVGGYTIEKYATGGYPTQGQLFIAREDGAEMVGSIGSKTAVANNDQITSAIASATYSAMSRALSENNGSINLVVEGDPNGMFRVMQRQANDYNKRTGRNAFA